MKILVVGGGGREHAMVWKLAQSPRKPILFCAPGNAGIASLAVCVPIKADDVAALKAFVIREQIDLTVVGPEAPLALGIADEFRRAKLRIFGPTKAAARLEASKTFSKEVMARVSIPTATAKSFDKTSEALAYVDQHELPIVVKADGLAQGKGVVIATTREQASRAVIDAMDNAVFGEAGRQVLIEQFLDGEELTIMAFTDGRTVVPMLPAQDHKRVGDGDSGLNTGGMGAYAPAPIGTPELRLRVTREILEPVVQGLSRMGSPFQGVLYAGLMIVKGVPYVLEFNARMGDPETQVVLPLLKTELLDVIEAVVDHRLDQLAVEWHDHAAVCVVMTAGGYPGRYENGLPIRGLDFESNRQMIVFHAGTTEAAGRVVTAGGRVLGVTGIGKSLGEAKELAYRRVKQLGFDRCHYRTDIADRALRASR
ncbi:phosphoribosylglycinamide synthetase phosphoribosylamine-glycine ligase [Nitrospira sp. KM1]|uniref:phosphoribosylamine--glycine ligase n=1 Tax=Nitrospira sp. KM1 TaxID=1936990 RepID=UPI0013A72F4C|nr:phosphoribosylamine--glycine ligase [Nitrospira sp. KM1]BCA53444.1 phosphoribosylglycinamide synthetase phosphoribosylamine-glycine ligase [Nitrospira sp. KM1]